MAISLSKIGLFYLEKNGNIKQRCEGVMEKIIEQGKLTIEEQFLQLHDTSINLSNIDNMDIFHYKKHPIFEGVKDWAIVWVVIFVILAIIKKWDFILTIYTLTIIPLLWHNIKENKKDFYGLRIETNAQKNIILKSDSKMFLEDLQKLIKEAAKNARGNYTINMDDHSITNNGIISSGSKNRNKVTKN